MHSARVQQRRQPQRGERPGAGGRSQLGRGVTHRAETQRAAWGWRARPRCAIPPPRPRPPPAYNTHMCVTAESGEAEGSRARAPAPPPSRAPPCPRRPAERTMPAKRSPAPPSLKYQYVSRAVPVPAPPRRRGPAAQLAARHTPRNAGRPRVKRCTAAAAALRLWREGRRIQLAWGAGELTTARMELALAWARNTRAPQRSN